MTAQLFLRSSALTAAVFISIFLMSTSCEQRVKRVLVFSKTKGWKHTSIPYGMKAVQKLGAENGFEVDTTRDAAVFTREQLSRYNAVVFLNTTGNVLNAAQQTAFEQYIQAGGGYVGIHSASSTEYDWPWYNKLMGAHFSSHPHHPGVRPGTVHIVDSSHLSTRHLPREWKREEEWYSYQAFYPGLKVLALLDENSYDGGTNGAYHPIAWYHEFDGGRAFYTGLGHQDESYSDPALMTHILGGIQYAMSSRALDYSKAYAVQVPEENRFQKDILAGNLDNPMELSVSHDGVIFFTELRSGKLQAYDTKNRNTRLVHQFPVCTIGGTGLIGVTLDPKYTDNHFIYLYYAPPTDTVPIHFYLSRFVVTPGLALDMASEKILLKVPVGKNSGAHHGGSLAFDRDGNLYLSTGDSSSPFPSNGYAPLDERPGAEHYDLDAQRGSSNTNDFKGKILRIHPLPDGTYSIPDGNLFSKGQDKTKPEIYIMGCRNPYRIAINPKTATLYWGEIGPDAGKDSVQGPMGYDEFNQAKKAGNYGWPYVIADNQPYADLDFETQQPRGTFDPSHPVNDSPNNTGLRELPPATPAMIWYPYKGSKEFPELGVGGRSAMAGAFYDYTAKSGSAQFPEYYDGALFVFDWMRNWVMALRFDEQEKFVRSEPFMASTGDFRRPIDLAFGQDGVMYMLEYGSVYGASNEDARLVAIRYNAGNRAPKAVASIPDSAAYAALDSRVFLTSELKTLPVRKTVTGTLPLKVKLSSKGSLDPDDDEVRTEWTVEGKTFKATGSEFDYTFLNAGMHPVILKVYDSHGLYGTDTVTVLAGNAQPIVNINTTANKSFFWDNTPFRYTVGVQDAEGNVHPEKTTVSLTRHVPKASMPTGFSLMANSDCKACHTLNNVSVGPSYKAVAARYKNQPGAVDKLAQKIIAGGGGNWSRDHVMSAHPQLSPEQATEIVKYMLEIDQYESYKKTMPSTGQITFGAGNGADVYTLTATYTDSGNGQCPPVTGVEEIALRAATVPAVYMDKYVGFQRFRNELSPGNHKSWFFMKAVDLHGITGFEVHYASQDKDGAVEVRMDSFAGPVLATIPYSSTGNWDAYVSAQGNLQQKISGRHDLYFIMIRRNAPNENIIKVKTIKFLH